MAEQSNASRGSWAQQRRARLTIFKAVLLTAVIEPYYFIFFSGLDVYSLVSTTGTYWKLCELAYGGNWLVNCRNLTATPEMETEVQKQSSLWMGYSSLAFVAPVIFVGPILAAFGDKHGRKSVILMGNCGTLLMGVVYIFMFGFARELPMFLLPIFSFLVSLTGFIAVVPFSCQAYVADITADPNLRTIRFALLSVVTSLANILSNLILSTVLSGLTYAQAALIPVVLWTLAFLYAMVVLKEIKPSLLRKSATTPDATKSFATTPTESSSFSNGVYFLEADNENTITTRIGINRTPSNEALKSGRRGSNESPGIINATAKIPQRDLTNQNSKDSQTISFRDFLMLVTKLFRDVVETLKRKREGNFRLYLILLFFAFICTATMQIGFYTIMNLYLLHPPLSWTPSDLAVFKAITSLIGVAGDLIGAIAFKKCLKLHETAIFLIAIASYIARLVLVGISNYTWMVYLSSALGLFGGLSGPACSSFISQIVAPDELGKVYSLLALAMDIGIIFSATAFNTIYASTLTFFAGFVFFFMAALMVAAFGIGLWIHVDFKRHRLGVLDHDS